MKTPITQQRLRNHLTYSWWKYALLVVLAIFGWNIIYTVTRYRPPEEKRVIMNLYVVANQPALNAYMAEINETLMPEMEEMCTMYSAPDSMYGDMIFSTHLAASEGDVYLVNRDYFQRYASSGPYLPLEDQTELMAMLEEAGISLSQGWRSLNEGGERHLFAIPCANLPGMAAYVETPADCYLVVLAGNRNDENVLRFLNIFVSDLLKPIDTPEE